MGDFCNTNSDILAENEISVFSNIFFNNGSLDSKRIDVSAHLCPFSFEALSRDTTLCEYEFPETDERFGCIANLGRIKADALSLTAEKRVLNRGLLNVKRKISLFSALDLVNDGQIFQTEYSSTVFSEIFSQRKILNKKGVMDFGGGLLVTAESFDNTKGKLKARQLKMRLALDPSENFQENEQEVLAAQMEKNPYSDAFQDYVKVARSTSIPASDPKADEKKQEDESAKADEKKLVPPEIGFLVNTGGTIEAGRDIEIKGSGAIYNAECGTISAKETMAIDIFGRLLNQFGSVISTNSAIVKSGGKIYNTTGSTLVGTFFIESNGFENGVGSIVKGGLNVKSSTTIYNFGEILTPENPLVLSTDLTIKNYGSLISDVVVVLEAKKELVNEGGKIVAPTVDAGHTGRIFNKSDGLIEATTGDVIFANKTDFLNEGRISSNDLRLVELEPVIPGSREVNLGGIIDAKRSLFISSNYPLTHIKGIINVPEFVFENRASETIDFAELLRDSGIRAQKASFSFPNAMLENKGQTILAFDTQIFAREFRNLSLLHCTGELEIRTKLNLVNAIADKDMGFVFDPAPKTSTFFPLGSDWDISHRPELMILLGGIKICFSRERKPETSLISSGGNLILESGTAIRNIGSFCAEKHLSLKSPQILNGWAYESVRHESLPELEFDYDYMESQPSRMTAQQGMHVEGKEFLNTFGTIDVNGGLISKNGEIFLNYAGSVDVRGDTVIAAPIFVNAVGTVRTNREDKRYWSLEFCNTDSPTLNVFDGSLSIDAPLVINTGGHIFARNGVFFEGKQSNGLPAIMDISGSGFGYTRMYSVNEYNCGKYSDRILGMSMATTRSGAIIRAELNEEVQKCVLPASVSSRKQVVIKGYETEEDIV